MLDFVGYTTGLPAAPPTTAGLRPLDFVGYPTGAPTPPGVTAGFQGILDFVGFPVGMAFTIPPAAPTRGGGIDRNIPKPKRKKRPDEDDEIWLLI